MIRRTFFLAIFLLGLSFQQVYGGYTIHNWNIVDVDNLATLTPEKHYQYGCEAYHFQDWKEAARHFQIVSHNFSHTQMGIESKFYLGISHFYFGEYEFANEAFSDYLRCTNNPEHLEDAIEYKYLIAQAFRAGAKRHIMGSKHLPAWLDATEQAIETYDEIITAFPCHRLAVEALYDKACLLWQIEDYRGGVESFTTLIRRFPKHEKAPESYLMICRLYLAQASKEFQNPDILALAELNVKKFENDFPTDERLEEARGYVQKVKETFAQGLYDTGRFFQRCRQPEASILYYQSAIDQFPETHVADHCRMRMDRLGVKVAAEDEIDY